jgi:hypothetical protein
MATIYVGTTGVGHIQSSQPYVRGADGTGSSTIKKKYDGDLESNLTNVPDYLTPHPYISLFLAFDSTADQEDGGITVITTTYKGVISDDQELLDTLAQHEFDKATTEAPVETHPRFALPRATPPVSATEIAQIELALQNSEDPPLTLRDPAQALYALKRRGIESYLKPGQIYKRTYVSADIPIGAIIDDVGKIKIPPAPAPPAPFGQNYLYLGASWKKQAGVVTIVESYQLSGPGGWEPKLYETA